MISQLSFYLVFALVIALVSAAPVRPAHGNPFAPGPSATINPQMTIAPKTDIIPVTNVQPVVNILPTDYNDYSHYRGFGYGDYRLDGLSSTYSRIDPDSYPLLGGYGGYDSYTGKFGDNDWYRRFGWPY
ncbi:hypothetical protein BGX27_008600 [Mortierella sp. AM989]|nr:hypothetical protein BGX27_008600 [Mortierella sp. AM989]